MNEYSFMEKDYLIIDSNLLSKRDFRLNANFYKVFYDGVVPIDTETIKLQSIAEIFHPGITKRLYIENKKYGIPFLSTSDMMCYEAVDNKYISVDYSNNLDDYIVHSNAILISRSGTIGNTVIVDKNIDGYAVTEHAIRIVLNDNNYLGLVYTFLISDYGKNFVKGQKSGAVIDEIYDEDVQQIEIPLVDEKKIEILNNKIRLSVEKREIASSIIETARQLVLKYNNLPPLEEAELETLDSDKEIDLRLASSTEFTDDFRLDAHFYNPMAALAVRNIQEFAKDFKLLYEVSDCSFRGGRSARNYVDKQHGVPFLSGKNIIQIRPDLKYISKTETNNLDEMLIHRNWILITRSGTLGRTAFVWKNYEEYAASEYLIRVIPFEKEIDVAYLYAFLSSNYGYHQLLRYKHSAVIDEITEDQISQSIIPIPDKDQQKEIGDMVRQAYDLRAEAIRLEDEAQEILTKALTSKE